MKYKALLSISLSFFCVCAQAGEKKKLVILTGEDVRHTSGAHEYNAGGILLKSSIEHSVLNDEVAVTHVHDWPEDTTVFDDADMILHYYNGNQFHPLNAHFKLVDDLVEKGVTQMFVHYACDPDTKVNSYVQKWTGGVYKDKFSANPHWTLKATLENHPINTGVEEYTLKDEWYLKIDFESSPIQGYDEPIVGKVHSVMSGVNVDEKPHKKFQSAVKGGDPSRTVVFWAKESENGSRGIAVTGGHYHSNWADDSFRKQVLNSVAWGLKIEVPEKGIESPEVTEDKINENLNPRKKGIPKGGEPPRIKLNK